MQQYRKKYTGLIEAVQLNHENAEAVAQWCNGRVINSEHGVQVTFPAPNGEFGRAYGADCILKHSDGRISKCDLAYLSENYEPVSAPSVLTPEELEKEATEAGKEYAMKHGHLIEGTVTATCVFADGYIAGHEAAASCTLLSVQPQSEGGTVQQVEGPWHIREEERRGAPETGDMSVDVKAVITDGKIEIETYDDGDLQPIVNALNASGCQFNSHHAAQLQCHILGYEKEQLQEQLKQLQSEGGLQWVRASERLPSINGRYFIKAEYIADPSRGIFSHVARFTDGVWDDGYTGVTHTVIEWLDESASASPSTANTAVSALQSILRNIDNGHWNCGEFREEIKSIAEQGLKTANTANTEEGAGKLSEAQFMAQLNHIGRIYEATKDGVYAGDQKTALDGIQELRNICCEHLQTRRIIPH